MFIYRVCERAFPHLDLLDRGVHGGLLDLDHCDAVRASALLGALWLLACQRGRRLRQATDAQANHAYASRVIFEGPIWPNIDL